MPHGIESNFEAIQALFGDRVSTDVPEEDDAPDKHQYFVLRLEETDPWRVLDEAGASTDKRRDLLKLLQDPALYEGRATTHDLPPVPDAKVLLMSQPPLDDFTTVGGQEMRGEWSRTGQDCQAQVVATLPANVAMSGQLTSDRARVDVMTQSRRQSSEGLSLVLSAASIDFISANQAIIVTHIASLYRNMPAGVVDYLTVQIIVARRREREDLPPLPERAEPSSKHMLDKQPGFREGWGDRLETFKKALAKEDSGAG